jgi:type II secretory ATPase GspE/PulE/Tfp pilus assembly ATPase PilB-like protein
MEINPTSAPVQSGGGPIGQLLLRIGLIRQAQLEQALAHKAQHGGKLGQVLVQLGFVTEHALLEALREQGRIFCVHLTPGIVDRNAAQALGEERARRSRALPINRIADTYTVAVEDPTDVYLLDELSKALGSRLLAVHAEPARISECLDAVFKSSKTPPSGSLEQLATSALDVNLEVAPVEGASASDDLNQPVINLVQGALREAFAAQASDIHFEQHRDRFLVRFRVDGVLYDRISLPREWGRPCLARIKILGSMDIAQQRMPQDGRAQIDVNGQRIDLRIATTPSLRGEGAVVRILDGGRKLYDLAHLGFDARQLDDILRMIEGAEGFILSTGPTGSGKTSTLYAMLQHLRSSERKIITLEDPVENELDGATQISTNAKIDLTFARGLRSVLRQDPDIVLVGEVRDHETAQIAIQAAQTGHLVLSTLHTVGAAEAVGRLADMGIEGYLLADTLLGVIGQRLLRRICTNCRERVEPDAAARAVLGPDLERGPLFAGKGCERCKQTGYAGRVGIFEVLRFTSPLADALRRAAGSDELRRVAVGQGMLTLRADALRKVHGGETTLTELVGTLGRG